MKTMRKCEQYRKKEDEFCEKIRGICDEIDRRELEGRDIAPLHLRLDAVMEEYVIFRRNSKDWVRDCLMKIQGDGLYHLMP